MTIEDAVKEIMPLVPSKKELTKREYINAKAAESDSRSGELGPRRFQEYADRFAPGKYRVLILVQRT